VFEQHSGVSCASIVPRLQRKLQQSLIVDSVSYVAFINAVLTQFSINNFVTNGVSCFEVKILARYRSSRKWQKDLENAEIWSEKR